jgi:hypothetical protein
VSRVTLVTCVSNGGGVGPGHSAIAIDSTIYTFQELNYGSNGSAWITTPLSTYLSSNTHRPVIQQRLSSAVDGSLSLAYIRDSIANDDDYIGSGVCSSQAASAIEAGYSGEFNTVGIDKPYEIYQLAKEKRIVSSEVMRWPGRDNCNWFVRTRIDGLLVMLNAGWSWGVM